MNTKNDEIFIEIKNKVYSKITAIINELACEDRKNKSKEEIIKMLDLGIEYSINSKLIDALLNNYKTSNGELDYKKNFNILASECNREYGLNIYESIPIRITNIEKIWLNSILKDPKIKLFLEDVTISKLKNALEHENLPEVMDSDNLIVKSRKVNNSKKIYQIKDNFKAIKEAILNKKGIKYKYKDALGKEHMNIAIPFKIEYSLINDCFYVNTYIISSCEDGNRPVKNRLDRFIDVKIIDIEHNIDVMYKKFKESIEERKLQNPIVVEIKSKNNAAERAFHLFSCFETRAQHIEEKDIYEIFIYYYSFEEFELIERILSLGNMAVVKEPADIREKVKDRIKMAVGRYSDEE